MNPIVRVLGKALRLVGISSPEDNLPRKKEAADPPSWKDKNAVLPVAPANFADKNED